MSASQCLGAVCALTMISSTSAYADSADACTLRTAADRKLAGVVLKRY